MAEITRLTILFPSKRVSREELNLIERYAQELLDLTHHSIAIALRARADFCEINRVEPEGELRRAATLIEQGKLP